MRWCLVIVFMAQTFVYAQEETFTYADHSQLQWEDFKATPKLHSQYHANTNSGFSYSWSYSKTNGEITLEYDVFSTFYPYSSWVHPDHKNAELLAHEQAHFDISELHARKLRKAMDVYKPGRSIRNDLRIIYNDIEAKRVKMQKLYDAESEHSQNEQGELKWQTFIIAELKRLDAYAKD